MESGALNRANKLTLEAEASEEELSKLGYETQFVEESVSTEFPKITYLRTEFLNLNHEAVFADWDLVKTRETLPFKWERAKNRPALKRTLKTPSWRAITAL